MTDLSSPEQVAAVVVAAGRGERLGAPDKVLAPLAGRPMLAWSLRALEHAQTVGSVVIVAAPHTQETIKRLVTGEGFAKVAAIVAGGERRQDSVAAGLAALPEGIAIVAIHDAARPLTGADLFDRCVQAAAETGAAIAAIPVADTLKRVTERVITGTVDRAGLWAAQTPQAFRLEVLRRAIAAFPGETVTDEARLCEAAGVAVAIVPASLANLKVTHPEDIAVADALLRAREEGQSPGVTRTNGRGRRMARRKPLTPLDGRGVGVRANPAIVRTGIRYDAHRFAPGRRLILGGVEILYDQGLIGHSDADVLLHAIADALLGAAALGDIGQHFPPSDERFRDADSRDLLREAVRLIREAGWEPANIDATVIAEAPRIAPHVALMRERIAVCLGIGPAMVGVKATTNEGMGAIGRGEGIAALATVTLVAVSPA
ncbi:MAG: 2-C-methyl-D-erythritol 4-phosphate cytidylyltransferase [Chloroflexia bacterium]|nr:2-C-methyl-D-erythritol 4-phosphate cytidylyltransferase [Chloroflexia bacterium]